jgi:hypothetical protein
VFVPTAVDVLIDRFERGIQRLAESCQGLLDRSRENRGADLAQHQIAHLQGVVHQAVDEKLIEVDLQPLLPRGIIRLDEQMPAQGLRYERRGEGCRIDAARRASAAQQILQEDHVLHQWGILDPAGELQGDEQVAQIPLELRGQCLVVGPFTGGLVELDIAQVG